MSLNGCNCHCSCSCRPTCTTVAVIAAAVLGVLAAFLQLGGVIAISAVLIWAFFGVAVGALGLLTLTAALTHRRGCCTSLGAALAGALGTVAAAVVLLVVDLAAGTVLAAILTGVLVFFVALTLAAVACYARCLCENAA